MHKCRESFSLLYIRTHIRALANGLFREKKSAAAERSLRINRKQQQISREIINITDVILIYNDVKDSIRSRWDRQAIFWMNSTTARIPTGAKAIVEPKALTNAMPKFQDGFSTSSHERRTSSSSYDATPKYQIANFHGFLAEMSEMHMICSAIQAKSA